MRTKKRKIALGILIVLAIINVPVLLDLDQKNRVDSYPITSLNIVKSNVAEDLPNLRQNIDQIDSIFDTLKTGNYPGSTTALPLPADVKQDFYAVENSWYDYKIKIQSLDLQMFEPKLQRSIDYVLEKNDEMIPISHKAIRDISSLDERYDRHKEIISEIKNQLDSLDSYIQSISNINSPENIKEQITEKRILVESNIRKLLQVPLDDLSIEKYSITSESLEPLPRKNSEALKEMDFIWESIQLRLKNIESGSLIPSGFATSIVEFADERDSLLISVDYLVNSWNGQVEEKIQERQFVVYSILGADVIVIIGSMLLLVKRRKEPELAEVEIEPIIVPQVLEAEAEPIAESFTSFWESIAAEVKPAVEPEPVVAVEPELEPKSIPQLILKILKERGQLKNDEIFNEIIRTNPEIKREAMRGRLSELRRRGDVKRNSDGFWRVPEELKIQPQVEKAKPISQPKPIMDKASQLYEKGFSLINEGKYDNAIKIFDEILDTDPRHTDALLKKGIAFNRLFKYDDALLCYEKIIGIDPNHVDALFYKGLALSVLGRHEESVSFYDKALAIQPNHQNTLLNKGISLSILGRGDESIDCFEKILENEPDNFEALYNKGEAYEKSSRYDEALSCFEKILENEPDHQSSLFYKGKILSQKGKHSDALIFYDKVLKSSPDHFDALYHKGLTLSILGGLDEAITCFDKILKNNPNHLDGLFNKGFTLSLLGKYKESIKIFEKVFEIYPDHPKALIGMIYCYFNIKKYDNALEYCDKVLEFEPSNSVAHYNKSRIYAIQNKTDDALVFLKQAVSENSNYKETAKKEPAFVNLIENPMFKFLTEQ